MAVDTTTTILNSNSACAPAACPDVLSTAVVAAVVTVAVASSVPRHQYLHTTNSQEVHYIKLL